MKKYRFRTREEFELIGRWIDEDGCPQGWADDMNIYLGERIIGSDCIALCELNDEFHMDGWSFSNHDYVVMEEEDYAERYITALADNTEYTGVKKGETIKILKFDTYRGSYILDTTAIGNTDMGIKYPLDLACWKLADGISLKEENNIALAKKMYPIGTKFYPAHVISNTKEYCIVTNDNFVESSTGILILTDEGDSYSSSSQYGTTMLNRNVYYEGKWAEIVKEDVVKPESLVGRWVKFLKNISATCTVGLYDEIVKDDCKQFITLKIYRSCTKDRFRDGEIELMPEGWSPLTEKTIPEFIPTHVKCVQRLNDAQIGKIYRVVNRSQCECENNVLYLWDSIEFQPSSKEAYDAQFVTTSSILPKKWCVKITSSNREVLNKWRKRQPNFNESTVGFIGWLISDAHDGTYTHWDGNVPNGYTEITLQQFYDNVYHIDVYDIIKKESSVYGHDPYETIKTKPLIDNVQSISVNLRTKKQINKLKF